MLKRGFDVIGSLTALLLLFPFFFFAAVMIKIRDGGPVFYRGERTGLEGVTFRIYKFRTMVVDAEKLGGASTAGDDARITPVGKFLRKYKFDELPQLINVLKGEMSIVGPRRYYTDELNHQLKKYKKKKSLLNLVLSVKPGITGLWQVSGRSSINFDKRIEMDAYYAKSKSILLDFSILLKTPWVMISGQNTS